jgi:hypothetical protein
MSIFSSKLRIKRTSTADTHSKPELSCFAGPPTRSNVWSSTFNPGRNDNMKKMGSSYYDKPVDNKTVWDQTLDSQRRSSVDGKSSEPSTPTAGHTNVNDIQQLAMKHSKAGGAVDMDAFMKSLKQMH